MATRDMTKREFDAACTKHGFTRGGLGYYALPVDGGAVEVNVLNAGPNRRAGLAYLLRQLKELNEKRAKATR